MELEMFKYINHEIDETENLIDHMTGGIIIGDDTGLTDDVKIMKSKVQGMKDAISMVKKATVDIEGVDAIWSMSPNERKILFRVVRIIMLFRRK